MLVHAEALQLVHHCLGDDCKSQPWGTGQTLVHRKRGWLNISQSLLLSPTPLDDRFQEAEQAF
jgi:hypothetical protein